MILGRLAPAALAALVACAAGDGTVGEGVAGHRNRLAKETSPYLLLHAADPVDWYPWGPEAFAKARAEDKPIFLSVGYSSCYWCHVMGRESFADPAIAALLADGFVAVKVDREERPDVDELAITAVQLLHGSGGWPASVFLTPELEPFFGGTYFPPAARGDLPAFAAVLREIRAAWTSRRPEVEETAGRVAAALRAALAAERPAGTAPPPASAADAVAAALAELYDPVHGGFGRAPKFPSPGRLAFLWEAPDPGVAAATLSNRRRVEGTLRRIGRGGIHDHLGGGFHRYTVDAAWRVPHFEKMLYDNALLAELFTEAASDPELEGYARDAADFLLGSMALPGGGFRAAIDAESEPVGEAGAAEEGAFYLWTAAELRSALGEEGFGVLAPVYGFGGEPDLPGGRHVLRLDASLAEQATALGLDLAIFERRLAPHLAALRVARARRPPPRTDDKVLADWNGLAIAALARAGQRLAEPRYLRAADEAASFVLARLRDAGGELLHSWAGGVASVPAFLDDYAFLIRGLLALHAATGDAGRLGDAERLAAELERRLAAPGGGYHLTVDDPALLVRSRTVTEGALPAGNAVAILDLVELASRTGREVYRQRAAKALAAFAPDLERYPQSVATLALAVLRYHAAAEPAAENRRTSTSSGEPATSPPGRRSPSSRPAAPAGR